MEQRKRSGRKSLKRVLDSHGIELLKNPEKLYKKMIEENPKDLIYADKIALFLRASKLEETLQSREKFESLGEAGYEGVLVRTMHETGFTYEEVRRLGEDLIFALGYHRNHWMIPELPATVRLPFIKEENGELRPENGSARGRAAYECGMKWLKSDTKLRITDKNISLTPTVSVEAVWGRKYMERASLDGYREADRILGLCCYYGVGREKNDEDALRYLLRADGYMTGSYFLEARRVLVEMMEKREKEKKKRIGTIGFAITVFGLCILSVFLFRLSFPVIIPMVSVCNIAVGIYMLFVRQSSEKKRMISGCFSFAVWCLMVLQICW